MISPSIDLELSAPVNLRDLGGIPIAGGTIRPGFAIRTDDLGYVTHDVASTLVADGLTTVIDLRSALEVSATGRGPLADLPVSYHHLPLIVDVGESITKDQLDLGHAAMGEMYVSLVEGAASQLVTALNVIAYAPGATAFHCAAGRDRTGVPAAVLLLAIGASDADIVADYALTGDNMPAIMQRTQPVVGAMWKALGYGDFADDASTLLTGSMEVSMRMMLARLRERHGDALAPLRAAGLGEETVARLRARALA